MINCHECEFYNREYDEERRSYDDEIVEENPDRHFCIMFSEHGIEKNVWDCKKRCFDKLNVLKRL